MDPLRRHLSLVLDVGPVVALVALVLTTGGFDRGDDLLATLALVVLPLLGRRSWPTIVLLIVALGSVATAARTDSPWIQICAVALASFALGERSADRSPALFLVLGVSAAMTFGFLAQDADPFLSVVLPFVVLLPSWLVGDTVRGRRHEAEARAEAADRAVRDRETRLRESAAEERRRVARELHDIVAHTVSVMQVQAGAARQVVRTSPDQAEASLLAVEATGRDAMAELRSLLGVLEEGGEGGEGGAGGGGLAPEPGVGQLDGLVDRVRQAGLPAEIEIDGEPRPLPAGLDVTVYRIVQEALTNALRYARDARTLVHLTFEPAQLRVEILDDGPSGPAPSAVDGTGRGLVGMRERATRVGGRLEAGPRLGGGYAVRAWLPLDPRPAEGSP